MKIPSIRTIEDLKPVLFDPNITTPQEVYWVFEEIKKVGDNRFDITIITNELLGRQYPLTYGHYHVSPQARETYNVISGNALFIFQKAKDGDFSEISEFHAVAKNEGESIIIPPGFAHVTVNLGPDVLVVSNLVKEDEKNNYEPVTKLGGMVYYVICENGKPKFIRNEKYKNTPEILKS